MKKIRSKRLFVFLLCIVVFLVLVCVLKSSPVEVATGITMISAPYLAAETIRKSDDKHDVKT